MWFFAWFRDNFNQVASGLTDTGSRADSIPVLGSFFSYPFYQLANLFYGIASAAASADSWSDQVYSSAGRVFSDIQGSISSTWPILSWSAGSFVSWIRSSAESVWPALTRAAGDWFSQVRSYILAAWPLLQWSSNQFFQYIRSEISGAWWILNAGSSQVFQYVKTDISNAWSILSDSRDSLWTWITAGPLQQQLGSFQVQLQQPVIDWVTGSLHYLIEQGFLVLNNSWSSFTGSFTWLLDKLIALMLDQAGHFADPLWQLLEAVLKSIQDKR